MNPKTPKSARLHIAIAGRVNAGKSSFLNMLAGQEAAITSSVPGTTTDVVEKTMELLPLGPVVLLDTAGLDDTSALGAARTAKTKKALKRADVLTVIVAVDTGWSTFEDEIVNEARAAGVPVVAVVNKTDLKEPETGFLALLDVKKLPFVCGSALAIGRQEEFRRAYKDALRGLLPALGGPPPALAGDLLPPGGMAVLVVPIDLGAPQGRLIVPQVQCIRDLLDCDSTALVVKDRELASTLGRLATPPDLVICDSQVVARTVADTPEEIKLTTFSILFARYKGDLAALARGAAQIEKLKDGDKVLIAEGCSHHPLEDDIGRVKIPRWLRQYTGADLRIESCAGHDFPDNLDEFKLIIHCGGCVMTRREMTGRMDEAGVHDIPMTNYGLAISALQGVLRRALSPFPGALQAYEMEVGRQS